MREGGVADEGGGRRRNKRRKRRGRRGHGGRPCLLQDVAVHVCVVCAFGLCVWVGGWLGGCIEAVCLSFWPRSIFFLVFSRRRGWGKEVSNQGAKKHDPRPRKRHQVPVDLGGQAWGGWERRGKGVVGGGR